MFVYLKDKNVIVNLKRVWFISFEAGGMLLWFGQLAADTILVETDDDRDLLWVAIEKTGLIEAIKI